MYVRAKLVQKPQRMVNLVRSLRRLVGPGSPELTMRPADWLGRPLVYPRGKYVCAVLRLIPRQGSDPVETAFAAASALEEALGRPLDWCAGVRQSGHVIFVVRLWPGVRVTPEALAAIRAAA